MSIVFDITDQNKALNFLTNVLKFKLEELLKEYYVECEENVDLFWERNAYRLADLDIKDVIFVAFHVTGSLDDCREIKSNGIRNIQYVLSHDTILSRLLMKYGIKFDIKNKIMWIDNLKYNIDYNYYQNRQAENYSEECLESVAHRLYYDYCINGFFTNDNIKNYGTRIHERPEFIDKLIELTSRAYEIDDFWSENSKPYKVFFFATADQIHKFTFGLDKNYEPYTENEQNAIKKWMLTLSLCRYFGPCGDQYIYIRNNEYINPKQIICYEIINDNNNE